MAIPIVIEERTGVDRVREPVLGGVPIPRGGLKEGGWFRLIADGGGEFAVEGTPAAFWPDGSVKWLHLCGTVDLEGGKQSRFTLVPAASAPADRLRVEEAEGCVRVRGGVLDVDVGADPSHVLSVSRAGSGEPNLEAPGLSTSLVFVSPDGERRQECELSFDGGDSSDTHPFGFDVDPSVRPGYRQPERRRRPLEVVVDTANRVVVRLGGSFLEEHGRAVSELILFVEVLRGTPEIRLQPVLIYLGVPDRDLVASLTLTAHTTIKGDGCRYGFAAERGRGYWCEVQSPPLKPPFEHAPRWPVARQVQLGSGFYRTEKRTFPCSSWVKAEEGGRSQGWCHLAGERGGITAATRYFWQEYPRSTTIDGDVGTITFGLVPPEAPPLDLRRYSPIVHGKSMYEAGGPGPFPSETHGARGIAKAHELMLRFHGPGEDDAPERGLLFARPCRLLTDTQHFAGTNVIGHVAPAGRPEDEEVEAQLLAMTDFIVRERDVRGWYGLVDFGDVQVGYDTERDVWGVDCGGYAWLNTEKIPDYGLWISALRAARADWLEAAVEMSRHNRDVDTYHRGMFRGCGTRHNVNHWGCADKEWRVSMPLVRRLHYYLTADPWTREVILETVAVYQTYERTAGTAPCMTAALAGILAKSEITGDPADVQVARNIADVFARAVRQDGQFVAELHVDLATGEGEPSGDRPFSKAQFMNTFGGQHTLVEVAELLEHTALSDALVAHAARCAEQGGDCRMTLAFLAHAYRRTGEERFAEAIRQSVSRQFVQFGKVGCDGVLNGPEHTVLMDARLPNKGICTHGATLHLVPYGLAALAERSLVP